MLSSKLALVTGAANGIGLAISRRFAEENATLILVDIQESVYSELENLKKLSNNDHTAFICDVSKSEQVIQLFESIKNTYKTTIPNVIVNCAGIFIGHTLVDFPEEDYDKVMNINFKGTFLITQAAVRALMNNYSNVSLSGTQTYASIINISSIAGKRAFPGNSTVYAASKGAMESMTKCVAEEYGKYRIRCNLVAPGPINTIMNADGNRRATHAALTKLGRVGEPNEVADACVFLASEMSSYMTGASVDCNGGMLC